MIYSIPYFEYAVGFSMTGFIVKSGYSIQEDLEMFQDFLHNLTTLNIVFQQIFHYRKLFYFQNKFLYI